MKQRLGLFLILYLFPVLICAQYRRPGASSAQFLKIPPYPRAMAMAEAYISVTDGAEAAIYNPAALVKIRGTDMKFSYLKWFAGINLQFASVSKKFNFGALAISYTGLVTDIMKVRTPLQPDGTGETFYSSNTRLGISYSRFLTDRVSFGVTVNYINISLYSDFSRNAYAVDIAALYDSKFRNFKFGMKISNFGSQLKFVNEAYPLPTSFVFGLSINLIERERNYLLLSVSGFKPNDVQPQANIGLEWNVGGHLFVRGGYRINHGVAKFTCGGGVKFSLTDRYLVNFDYAMANYSDLGNAHCFSLGLRLD
ncbi:MAG: hypothetical protein DRP88_01110 [Candidatus Neomarinimicrobiota bacterium]|nr:MAG: hypothetical protein DRP88_01110 [Candidatus Neomarinimicrobiota bacterium]